MLWRHGLGDAGVQVGREKELTRLVSFDYGQRHKKELDCAALAAAALGVRHEVVDIANLARFLSGSALTDPLSVDVPDGHYAEDNMRTTVVPNRNAIMLAIAFGIAAGEGAASVAFAVHAGDHLSIPTAGLHSLMPFGLCNAARYRACGTSSCTRPSSI